MSFNPDQNNLDDISEPDINLENESLQIIGYKLQEKEMDSDDQLYSNFFQDQLRNIDPLLFSRQNSLSEYQIRNAVNSPNLSLYQYRSIGSMPNIDSLNERQKRSSIEMRQKKCKQKIRISNGVFHPMPRLLTAAVRYLGDLIEKEYQLINQQVKKQPVHQCFRRFIHHILPNLNSKNRTKEELQLILNKINPRLNGQMRSKRLKTSAVTNYFQILTQFSESIVNEAKQLLREKIYPLLTKDWIKKFIQIDCGFRNEEELKVKVLKSCLQIMRKQLQIQGQVSACFDRATIINLTSSQECDFENINHMVFNFDN